MTRKLTLKKLLPALLVLLISQAVFAQGVSPLYDVKPGANEVAIVKNFTLTLNNPARIKSVSGFDPEVIKIDQVPGFGDRVTVFALETGVTTVTMVDEFDQTTELEIFVKGDVRHLESYIRRHYPNDDVRVEEVKGAVLLTGWVTSPENINRIVEIAQRFYPDVLNHMQTGGVQTVQLKAEIMEVNRTKLRRMGMNFGISGTQGAINSTPGPITPVTAFTNAGGTFDTTFSGLANTSLQFGFLQSSRLFRGYLDALRTEGLLKIHAKPTVTTMNGSPSNLLNGGEAPVLVPAGLGTTGIEFKPFGTILDGVPHILGNGRLRLQVKASVVERDFANSVQVDGVIVPSFTTRSVDTQVEMNFGETLVIGGLVTRRDAGSAAKLPFFGELPWIGAAFGRKEYTESETELIIMITPLPGAPMRASDIPPGGPGKFTDVPTDVELFFHNHLEVPKTGDECSGSFNCQACRQNGRCGLHPNGCGAAGCATEGCNTTSQNTPGLIGPSISPAEPGSSQSAGSSQAAPRYSPPLLATDTTNPASQSKGILDRATTEGVSARPVSQQRNFPSTRTNQQNNISPGLLSPLNR